MLNLYTRAIARLHSARDEEKGATAVEYALIIGLVSLALIVAAILLVEPISQLFTDIAAAISGAEVPGGGATE